MINKTLFIYTESSLHAGIGSGVGSVDLPIQRERVTGYPIIQGSGLKGALRSQFPQSDKDSLEVVFGPDTNNAADHASAISVGDARLLAFPVRSLKGVFAWTTSIDALARLKRDASLALPNLPPTPPANQAWVTSQNLMLDNTREIILEEYQYQATSNPLAQQWATTLADHIFPNTNVYQQYYRQAFIDRFAILPLEDYRDFVLYATEIETRIKLKQATKTVDGTGLFTQEALPADCLLYAPVMARKARIEGSKGIFTERSQPLDISNWLDQYLPAHVQIGGDETIGYGFCSVKWS